MADIFAVIADPTRRELLAALLERRPGEVSVGQLVGVLNVSQPTVSKHLRVLRESGLVHVREEGQHRYYRVVAEPLVDVHDWVSPFVVVPVEVQNVEALAAPGLVAVASRGPGVSMPAPFRRAAENLPDVGDVGATLGRVVAGAQSRIPGPIRKRLGNREQG
jgi:DNA-binding transcriptional ArsR family regulator